MSLLDTASLIVTPNGAKSGKLYSVVPSSGAGDLDVTRATTATRVNSSGLIESVGTNVPRLDYSNGSCPSILVEPQRTNLSLYSEKLISGFAFSFTGGVFTVDENTTDTLDPFGNNNADKFTTTSNFNDSYTTTSGSGSLTLSIFAKKGTNDIINLYHHNVITGILFETTFNLNTGTIVGSSGTVTPKIEQFANGWYRCSISGADTLVYGNIFRVSTYTGTSYLYGWQLEAGSYATSYIPTTSASVTRNADVISKTGISSLIGQTEGTLLLDVDITTDTSSFYVLGSTIGSTSSHYITINTFNSTGNIYMEIVNGTQQALIISSVNSGHCKIAVAYKQNDIAFYINGNLIGTDSSATIPPTSSFGTEYETTLGNRNIKNYNAIALWKTRLTNSQLSQLTTI